MNRYHAAFIPPALLLLALADLPYGYYQFLRIAVTGWALFLAWTEYQRRGSINGWAVAFAFVAVLFNPVAPVYMHRESWALWDAGCAILFGAYGGLRLATKSSDGGQIEGQERDHR